MTEKFDDLLYDAFMLWAFEPPPIARPGPTAGSIRFRGDDMFPEVAVNGAFHPVISVTSGWLSTAGAGWQRFSGDPDTLAAIDAACDAAQRRLLRDGPAFEAAWKQHSALPDDTEIGGLPVVTLAGGRRVVRLDDIAVPEVRAGLETALDTDALASEADDRPGIVTPPPGTLDAGLWWRFYRTWNGDGG